MKMDSLKSYDTILKENDTLYLYFIDIAKRLSHANQMYKDVISELKNLKTEHDLLLKKLAIIESSNPFPK